MKTIGLILHPYGEKESAGLGRSIYNLAREIVEQDQENKYLIFTKGHKERPDFKGDNWDAVALPEKRMWLDRYLWRYRKELDAYVFFTPVAPLFWKPKNMLVVVHDMGAWVLNGRSIRNRIIQFIQKTTLYRAKQIVTVSEATKQSLITFIPKIKGSTTVIHNGFDAVHLEKEREVPTSDAPYVLFLGVLKKRKNPLGVLRAFEIFKERTQKNHRLIFAGAFDPKGTIASEVSESPYKDDIVLRGHVSDEERTLLYRNAQMFVFPSLFEGFGLPILEAMSVGIPVITSRGGATEEVAGNAATLVDPRNYNEIAAAMEKLDENSKLREAYIQKGKEQVKEFSWRKAGERYIACIRTILRE